MKLRLRQYKYQRKEKDSEDDVLLDLQCSDEWDDAVSSVRVQECSARSPFAPLTVDQMLNVARFVRTEGIATLTEVCEYLGANGSTLASSILRLLSRSFPLLVVRRGTMLLSSIGFSRASSKQKYHRVLMYFPK